MMYYASSEQHKRLLEGLKILYCLQIQQQKVVDAEVQRDGCTIIYVDSCGGYLTALSYRKPRE